MIAVDNLSFGFRGQAANLVDGVSLALNRNETLCIVGESGCGKSVTALSLMGLLPPDATRIESGTITFDGEEIRADDFARLGKLRGNRMAMIFQEPMTSLNPAYKIGDQLTEAVRAHNGCTKAEARDRALQALEQVGIPAAKQRLDEYPHQLSGGMRQRVMIAMALVNDPSVLIADEPTTALDVTVQAQILDLIASLQDRSGMGTIMITHDLGVVAQVATTVAVMYAGRIVEIGTAQEIFDDPQHPYTIGLMSSVPRLTGPRQRLSTVPGLVPTPDKMPAGCRFSTRCPFARPACATVPPLAAVDGSHRVACHFAPLETRLEAV
ncbi:ABC transporter ATP-binding protein [Pseudooceanicola sp. LIPI14-2-Ac024]|uniref:ABC transporter ATP-binding protein n=1 Tax=Pseudooceanicola sp. LIPI14-2-Ac024 TaxID=3344875 RepID=UPI0035CEC58D